MIAEDHLMMRDVLRKVCTQDLGHNVVAEALDGHQTVDAVLRTNPDLLLLDLQLPALNGFGALTLLRRHNLIFKTLILSSYCDDYTVYCVEQAHVNGFVDKNTSTITILGKALQTISEGHVYLSDTFKARSAKRRSNPKAFDKLLTDRERTILIMLSKSLTDCSVAAQLNISAATVEKHRFNIFRKLGLHSTAELVQFANDNGFNRLEISPAHNE